MKIAIDLNDVIRDYSRNFVKYFKRGVQPGFDETEVEFTTNDMSSLLPFTNEEHYRRFVYEDYPFELYGKCPAVESNLPRELNQWIEFALYDEDVEVMFVSPMEADLTIQSTFSFLAKIGSRVREVYFPIDSATVWDRCDVLITASPRFMNNVPEGKKLVKIEKAYNTDYESNASYASLLDVIADMEFVGKMQENE